MEQRMKERTMLFPRRICETRAGNLAHAVGRLAFLPGRPMLVEHVGGIYLEHDLTGAVLTAGYGPDYSIMHVWEDEILRVGNSAALQGVDIS